MLVCILFVYAYEPIYNKLNQTLLQICYLCEATKGSGDISMAFTDIQDSANWRSTYLQSFPWTTTPAYASLEGFSLKMLFPDMLHVWNLGVARDLIGTAMKTILQDRIIFDGPNIDARLKQATESLRAYARANKYGLKMKRFTKKKLTWQAKKFPEFKGSGSDAHVVGVWLGDLLAPYSDSYRDICSLFWCSNRLVRVLYSADRFLVENERNTVKVLGRMFVQLYLNQAAQAVQNHVFAYRVRPKLHLFLHLSESIHSYLNPRFYATWLDEDWLKKISRTMRLTSTKTSQFRTMERWLMSIPYNLKLAREEKNQPQTAGMRCHARPGLES